MSSSNKMTLTKICKQHYHVLPIANHIYRYLLSRCLSSVFTKISTRKTKQSVSFGLLLLASIFTTPVSAQLGGVNICDRTEQVQRGILEITDSIGMLFNIEGPSNCGAFNPNLSPKNLAAITRLKSGDFDNLSGLASLRLQGNPITTLLPTDLFEPLPSASIQIDLAPFGNLPDIPFLLVGNTTTLDVSGAFISRDATGADRAISFSVTPTDTAVVFETVDEAVVTITATGTSSTTISATANDGVGTDATRIVAVTN